MLGSYEFLDYKSKVENSNTLNTVNICGEASETIINSGKIIGDSVAFARDLGNHPANILTPTLMAKEAKDIAKAPPNHHTRNNDGCRNRQENELMLKAETQQPWIDQHK